MFCMNIFLFQISRMIQRKVSGQNNHKWMLCSMKISKDMKDGFSDTFTNRPNTGFY